jgi:hypothetical protein
MSILSLIKPIIGQPDATQDPKIVNALTAIETWANGQIDSTNLKALAIVEAAIANGSVSEGKLSAAVQALLNAKVSGLAFVVHAASAEAKAGELFAATKGLTVTLPKAELNVSLGVYNFSAEAVKVKVAAGDIIDGDVITEATEITLLRFQHVTLQGDAAKVWLITAGEPKRESAYTAAKTVASGVELEPSATRPTQVVATMLMGSAAEVELFCGGVRFSFPTAPGASGANQSVTFICPAGAKWKWVEHKATVFQVEYSYLSL